MDLSHFRNLTACGLAGATALALLIPTPGFSAAVAVDTKPLVKAVTVRGVRAHQWALQQIANRNGGTRASGTPGFTASVSYVVKTMRAAGYKVTTQNFDFVLFEELSQPAFSQVSPTPTDYEWFGENGFITMEYSGPGDVTAPIQAVDLLLPPGPDPSSSNSGCEAEDFQGFVPGNIALIQRGTCTFGEKALLAQSAGASGVIIFNEGQDGRTETLNGTLGSADFTIPVIGTAFELGNDLAAELGSGPVTVSILVDSRYVPGSSTNVFAETRTGRADRVVVVGAHLDSVPEGPGINDNGSGTGGLLEIAQQMSKLGIKPRNKVRFAWWGAEESGLIGSTYYVNNLDEASLAKIALNLNFDMIGSPNFVRFIYDGDGDAFGAPGPAGSEVIEAVFENYFDKKNLPTQPTAFDGRSDYGPFIAVGIPAGGLFTGAEELKTAEQAAIFGGTAGVALDPCYHQACDRFINVNYRALGEMSDAAAHTVLTFAMNPALICTPAASAAARATRLELDYKGPHLAR